MKRECKYVRKGHLILEADSRALVADCKTINKAKHHSWQLQAEGKELGYGLVRVERS